jgi:hypothetical protein
MEDITPLNLEDQPKLFGLRFDQLIAILVSFILATQLYSWLAPVPFAGHDLRLDFSVLIALVGPAYTLLMMDNSGRYWENLLNFFFSSQIFIPGPDPNPVRYLNDEECHDFSE